MPESSTPKRRCSVDGCDRKHQAKGFCASHYSRYRRGSNPHTPLGRVTNNCAVLGCERSVVSRIELLCSTHYRRLQKGDDLLRPVGFLKPNYCSIEGCTRRLYGKSYCKAHYRRVVRTGKEGPAEVNTGRSTCAVVNCEDFAHGGELCKRHWRLSYNYKLSGYMLSNLPSECMVCGSTSGLHIDHDHSCCLGPKTCGKCVRGVLCRKCNMGMGFFADNVEYLCKAIEYLGFKVTLLPKETEDKQCLQP